MAGNDDPAELENRLRAMIIGNTSAAEASQPPQQPRSEHAPQRPGLSPRKHQHQNRQPQQQWRQPQQQQQYPPRGWRGRGRGPNQFSSQQPGRGMHSGQESHAGPQHDRFHQPGPRRGRAMPSRFTPLMRPQQQTEEHFQAQCQFLERIVMEEMPKLEMTQDEVATKDAFRAHLEQVCRSLIQQQFPENPPPADLLCFGSISSGFGMPGSDMDLALVSAAASPDFFRQLEKRMLELGHGARLLTRTRVPILKICENPGAELLDALREERVKWDNMSPEEREKYDHPARHDENAQDDTEKGHQVGTNRPGTSSSDVTEASQLSRGATSEAQTNRSSTVETVDAGFPSTSQSEQANATLVRREKQDGNRSGPPLYPTAAPAALDIRDKSFQFDPQTETLTVFDVPSHRESVEGQNVESAETEQSPKEKRVRAPRPKRMWYREKRLGPLDFPKDGVGIQCDINFANPLGMHNTLLLRCYSRCDIRVRLMVLFVKAWASKRKINSARNGTLSSYGYVLMVLHFLVNLARPPVCPNLQLVRRNNLAPNPSDPNEMCEGWDVRFWRDETEIQDLAEKTMLTQNREPLGVLLRNFFLYYAQPGHFDGITGGFAWTQNVLSLRTPGGILTKQEKGWRGAKTTIEDDKEVRHRYLFAIEDPFELEHNVARTVTHNGIVAIRDEFRRAWRILSQIGREQQPEGDLLAPVESQEPPESQALPEDGDSTAPKPSTGPQADPKADDEGAGHAGEAPTPESILNIAGVV